MSDQHEADVAALKAAIGYDPVPLSIRNHPEITFEYRTAKDRDGLIERILAAGFTQGSSDTLRARLDSIFRALVEDGEMTPMAVRQIQRVLDAEEQKPTLRDMVQQGERDGLYRNEQPTVQPPTREQIAGALPSRVAIHRIICGQLGGPSTHDHQACENAANAVHEAHQHAVLALFPQPTVSAEPVSIADMVLGTTPVVCICGSTRFRDEMTDANRRLTLGGSIVVAPGVFGHSGDTMTDEQKTALDALHFQKIDLAQSIYVVNPGGYIGESTTREIAYAERTGKPVVYLVDPSTIRDVTPPPEVVQ